MATPTNTSRRPRGARSRVAPRATRTSHDAPTPAGSAGARIEQRPIASLRPAPRNPRLHSPEQVSRIAASIQRFGFITPILIDGAGQVIAGHGRLLAARQLGLTEVPTLSVVHLTPLQQRAYLLADNRLAELASWDRDSLVVELEELSVLDPSFDLTLIGYSTGELDVLLADPRGDAHPPAEDPPPPPPVRPVTRLGDLWQVGPHRLLCADATQAASYRRLLGAERAQLVFTDPPYNVKISGHVSGLGKTQHREFAMASGELSRPEFTAFLQTVFEQLVAFSTDGSLHYLCMDWRHLAEILAAGKSRYSALLNLCVWAKTNAGMGSLYRSQHELILVFKAGTGPHINHVELGKHGRYRTNVWSYPGVNAFGAEREAALRWHPTVKPLALVQDAIRDASRRHAVVLDAFVGSGTTLAAAATTGRRGRGLELDPGYCDVALTRLRDAVGQEPVLVDTGATFSVVAEQRAAPAQAA
jgi:DNA modification methylase